MLSNLRTLPREGRHKSLLGVACLSIAITLPGCQLFGKKEKKEEWERRNEEFAEKLADPDRFRLIHEVARVSGSSFRRYESLGLITNLPGTGGLVRPSPQRDMMLEEIRRNDVFEAEALLDSPTTAVAKLSVYANPCDEKGDRLDVLVECSSECDAKDLREGYLMESHLFEYFTVQNKQLRKSNEKGIASGDILIYPASYNATYDKEGKLNPLRGVVLNGARLKDDLRLAIIVNNDYRHVSWIKAMEVAINRRFYYQEGGKQRTVAVAKNDYEIQLGPFPKYQLDPAHYLGTVMSIGFGESQGQVAERVRGCQRMLGSPDTARKAAWELEAIGTPEATEVLNLALANHDDEIRFYAAYSLAYLDRPESVPILQNLAKYQPKYRAHCLIGLCINDHPSARTALEGLLQEPESEVRYGAYHYLRQRDPRNPMVVGEPIGESFRCVQIPTTNPGIFVSMERRPEIVLMGGNQQLQIPKQLEPTPWLRITPLSSGLIRVAKRAMTGEINQTIITADIISLIKAMPAIGGNYGDIVHALDAVSQINGCSAPIAFHPLPRTSRLYGGPVDGGPVDGAPVEAEPVDGGTVEESTPADDGSTTGSFENWSDQSKDRPRTTSS